MRRLYRALSAEIEAPEVPDWLFTPRFAELVGSEFETGADVSGAMLEEAVSLVGSLSALESRILGREPAEFEDHPVADGLCKRSPPAVSLARLLLGACCEAWAALRCSELVAPCASVSGSKKNKEVAVLYRDSFLAATWTSAHAVFLHDVILHGMAHSPPTIHSVPNESSELDLSDIYARRYCPRSLHSKEAGQLLSLMTRCTNPGARGWPSIVNQAIEKSDGTKRVMANAVIVSITGMHSMVHPAVRLHWRKRYQLGVALFAKLPVPAIPGFAQKCSVEFKEITRRMSVNCTQSAYATHAALLQCDHPIAILKKEPVARACAGLELTATAFVEAGAAFVDSQGAGDICELVSAAFTKRVAPPAEGTAWHSSYLGKGIASINNRIPAISVAASVWSMAFRANFIPFWVHSSTQGIRASRLDAAQYRAIHGLNSATRLTLLLSDEERLRLQRIALQTPSAGIMTLEEIAGLLGIDGVRGSGCNGGSKSPAEGAFAIGDAGPENAARILSFCRSAAISNEILIYDLGETTRRMQASAIIKRLLLDEVHQLVGDEDSLQLVDIIPDHAKHLYACMQCKRVSNAASVDARSKHAFNELGTSGSMIYTDPATGKTALRCAKRSSASLRTAVAFEEHISDKAVESELLDHATINNLLVDYKSGSDTGAASRVRRDAKNALEQRVTSVACGAENMLSIPMLGKAVRLWSDWWAICSYCGCFVRFQSDHRVGAEICCMRCDYRMLHRKEEQPASAKDAARKTVPKCRFCAKEDPQRSGVKWKLCRAPLDTSGANANLPPPLRTVFFCPQHFRNWIPGCLKSMPMRVVLSHIAYGARPCFGAGGAEKDALAELPTSSRRPGRGSFRKAKRRRA